MLTVNPRRIAEKAKVDFAVYEGNITSLIEEMLPSISLKVEDAYLQSSDENIKSVLNLGATEIIVGEFLKERANDEDDAEGFKAGIVDIGENKAVLNRGKRSGEWIESGWQRLKPYLKAGDYFYFGAG